MRDDRLRAAVDRGAKSPQIVAADDPAGRVSLLNEVNDSLQKLCRQRDTLPTDANIVRAIK
jgi:hypothetical protein